MKIILCFLTCVLLAEAKPFWDFDSSGSWLDSLRSDIRDCHGLECPTGTVGCSQSSETSTDTKTIMTTIKCEDINGKVLNTITRTDPNKYEGSHIARFTFTGQYSLNGGQTINNGPGYKHSINTKGGDANKYDLVETFDD